MAAAPVEEEAAAPLQTEAEALAAAPLQTEAEALAAAHWEAVFNSVEGVTFPAIFAKHSANALTEAPVKVEVFLVGDEVAEELLLESSVEVADLCLSGEELRVELGVETGVETVGVELREVLSEQVVELCLDEGVEEVAAAGVMLLSEAEFLFSGILF